MELVESVVTQTSCTFEFGTGDMFVHEFIRFLTEEGDGAVGTLEGLDGDAVLDGGSDERHRFRSGHVVEERGVLVVEQFGGVRCGGH